MSKKGLYLMLGGMMMGGAFNSRTIRRPISEEDVLRKKEESQIRNNKKNGLKKFNFPEGTLWALNEKNAKRKAKKKGWTFWYLDV